MILSRTFMGSIMPEIDINWLQTFIKRPPSLISLVTIVALGAVFYANTSNSLADASRDRQTLSLRIDAEAIRLDAMSKMDEEFGRRLEAFSYRVTEIEKNSDAIGAEFHGYVRDQALTTTTVFKELADIKATLATISANVAWMKQSQSPGGPH